MMKRELTELVYQDRMELLLRAPFYGRIICSSELVVVNDRQVHISCTDCRRIFLSAVSYPNLLQEQRLAVLAHEVLHIALRHAFRIGGRAPQRFSFAADADIYFLLRENFEEPGTQCYNEEWDGLTAEEIYELLPKELPFVPPLHCFPDRQQALPASAEKSNLGMPTPETTKDAQNEDCSSKASDREDSQKQEANGDSFRKSGGGSGSSASETDAGDDFPAFAPHFDLDSELFCRQLLEDVKMSPGMERGRVPAGFAKLVEKLSSPKINWRILLRQFVRECRGGSYHWLAPNRRFIAQGMYLPGRRDRKFQGVVALDTSGSTVDALPEFITELDHLLRAFGKYELTILECDAELHQVWRLTSDMPSPDLKKHLFKGGGGTDFAPVFKYIRTHIRRPDVLIFFTDGGGACPEVRPPYPVLWLLTAGGEAPVKWGQRIHIARSNHDCFYDTRT